MQWGNLEQNQDSGKTGKNLNKVCSLVDNIVSMLIFCS